MAIAEKQEILLESGTNELEIIEFYVGSQPLGINVQKLKEIIPFDESVLTAIPGSQPAMLGTLLLRGAIIPLIDLKTHLNQRAQEQMDNNSRPVVMVCEFNHRTNGFKIDGVNQIHRVSWNDVEPIAPIINQYKPRFTGTIHIDNREILILDLEHIVGEFDPDSVIGEFDEPNIAGTGESSLSFRKQAKILMAEDSTIIRTGIEKVLLEAGFEGLEVFVDGEACYQRILQLKKHAEESGDDIRKHLSLVISDIEMPRMDGLTLCRKVKEGLGYKHVPVLLFSSLINPPMEVKCDSVEADGYAAKPEIAKLIAMMDQFIEQGVKETNPN
ncbi:MAG: chemotaxis protein [Desulfuromusa sp.]|jgi:two-component system chemotaxis response regulator CheV|nr:chemotaxis protein [Desulfuromusa sp.]